MACGGRWGEKVECGAARKERMIRGMRAWVRSVKRVTEGAGGAGLLRLFAEAEHHGVSLGSLRCLLSVARCQERFSPIIISCDGRYSLPHPLNRFIQTSPTYRLSDPSRLLRAAPSAPPPNGK